MKIGSMMKMCGVKLVDRVLSDVLRERVSLVVKTEDILVH